jgi:hypothetical protein
MQNLLLQNVEYKIVKTSAGTWKRFLYPSGQSYAEYTSHGRLFGLPVVHYTSGVCPETGRRRIARGVIAVGRVAVGFVAIGQAAFGVAAIGQAALGLLLGLGQLAVGAAALGQLSLGGVAVGQVAVGGVVVGQLAVGVYALAQQAVAQHGWDMRHCDPAVRELFGRLFR